MVKKLFKYIFIASKYVVPDGRIFDREHIYEIKKHGYEIKSTTRQLENLFNE